MDPKRFPAILPMSALSRVAASRAVGSMLHEGVPSSHPKPSTLTSWHNWLGYTMGGKDAVCIGTLQPVTPGACPSRHTCESRGVM